MNILISQDRKFLLIFLSILILGLYLRLNQLDLDELWTDEALTGFIALTSDWLSYLRIDNTPPLYNLFMRLWCGAITCNEYGLRLPSVISGIIFIIFIGIFCKELYGKKVALFVALLVALSPIHIYYSQEARVYSILLTTLLAFLYIQWQIINQNTNFSRYILFLFITICALYLHYFSIIVIGISLAILTIENLTGYKSINKWYFYIVSFALLTFIPWLFFSIFSEHSSSSELGWIAPYFADKSIWQLPFRSITTYLFGPQFHFLEVNLFIKRTAHIPDLIWFQSFNVVIIGVITFTYFISYKSTIKFKTYDYKYLLESILILFVSLLSLMIISILIRPVYVVGRYDLIGYPAFLIIMGHVIYSVSKYLSNSKKIVSQLSIVFVVGFILFQLNNIYLYKNTVPYTSVKNSVPSIIEKISDQDGLLIATPRSIEYWYYFHYLGYDRKKNKCNNLQKQFTCNLFPYDLEEVPALLNRYYRLAFDESPDIDMDYFLQSLKDKSRVHLLLDSINISDTGYEFDPLGFKIAEYIKNDQFIIENINADLNLISFRKY